MAPRAYFAPWTGILLPAFTAIAPGFLVQATSSTRREGVFRTATLLAQWTGAVAESTRPYQNVNPWPESSRPSASNRATKKRLENVFLIQG